MPQRYSCVLEYGYPPVVHLLARLKGAIVNLDHLNYFKTLVDLKSRSAAAKKLSITPSTLSLALSKLEQEVGVPLIEKRRGVVELTPEGEIFFEYADTSLRFLNNGLKLIQERRGGVLSERLLSALFFLYRAKIGLVS